MTDNQPLTEQQSAALELVRQKPGLTVENYATVDLTLCIEIVEALGWLIFNGYVVRNKETDSLTVKG